MRVFLDTNVLVSALMGRGFCRDLLDSLILEHQVLLGAPVHRELNRILVEKFRVPDDLLSRLNEELALLELVPESDEQPQGIPDPDDIAIIACALSGTCDCLVTGDKALLALDIVKSLPILSPRQCWDRAHRRTV